MVAKFTGGRTTLSLALEQAALQNPAWDVNHSEGLSAGPGVPFGPIAYLAEPVVPSSPASPDAEQTKQQETRMATKRKGGYIRWTTDEWNRVGHVAAQILEAGGSRYQAVVAGNKAIAPKRQVTDDKALQRLAYDSNKALTHALERVAAMTPAERAELGDAVPQIDQTALVYVPRANTKSKLPEYGRHEGRGKGKPAVRWSEFEWALLARRVMNWQALGSNCTYGRLYMEAQEIELPPERRRPGGALQIAGAKNIPAITKQAATEWAYLVKDIPYDPTQRKWKGYEQHRPVSTPAPAPRPQQPNQWAKPQEASTPVPAPTPAPTVQSPAVAPSRPLPEPTVAPVVPTASHEIARNLGVSLANALVPIVEGLLNAQLVQLRQEANAHGEQLAKDMSAMLLAGLDRMLGGTGTMPPAQPVVEPPLPPVDAPRPKRLRVDVVGFETGRDQMMVKHKLNGQGDHIELHFVHPDQFATYAPHRDRATIMLTQRIPHSLRNKITASGCKPIYVKRTVGHVVDAINNLLRQASALAD